jgi:DNA-binding GntR family transcriptional regulator
MPTRSTGVSTRTLLRDDAYRILRDSIVDGTRAPGERLRDTDLMEQLGIGRTPIREALLRLERAGLIETRPGHWTTVTRIETAATRNAQEIAASLHQLAMTLAVHRMTAPDHSAMDAANRRFAAAIAAGDAGSALAADDDFHGVAVGASDNPMIGELLEQVAPLVRRVERLRFRSRAGHDSVAQHEEIVALCRAGDAEGAALAVARNWRSLADTLAGAAGDASGPGPERPGNGPQDRKSPL